MPSTYSHLAKFYMVLSENKPSGFADLGERAEKLNKSPSSETPEIRQGWEELR